MPFTLKFNWGVAIVFIIVSFMLFILHFVYRMASTKVDLVSSGYYESGIQYDAKAAKIKNTAELAIKPKTYLTKDALRIQFPHKVQVAQITLYRPGNQDLDQKWKITQPVDTAFYNLDNLVDGFWKVQLDWDANGKSYYYESDWNINP